MNILPCRSRNNKAVQVGVKYQCVRQINKSKQMRRVSKRNTYDVTVS
jgi:hypothetical protein